MTQSRLLNILRGTRTRSVHNSLRQTEKEMQTVYQSRMPGRQKRLDTLSDRHDFLRKALFKERAKRVAAIGGPVGGTAALIKTAKIHPYAKVIGGFGLAGTGVGPLIVLSDEEIENTRKNLVLGSLAGGASGLAIGGLGALAHKYNLGPQLKKLEDLLMNVNSRRNPI